MDLQDTPDPSLVETRLKGRSMKRYLELIENRLIMLALHQTRGRIQQAADLLKIARTTLSMKIRSRGLAKPHIEEEDDTQHA